MGHNRKRLSERRVKQKNRERIKLSMNKKVFFTLTNCARKLQGISHRYCYKANMHNVIFKGAKFENVRYQSSIITKCNFNEALLTGVDFCNCNLRKSSFKKAKLKDVCFINCNIEGVDFQSAEFENVTFVCVGFEKARNLVIDSGCCIYRTYPRIELDKEIQTQLLRLSEEPLIYEPHVLHVTKNKLNYWSLKILEDIYGVDAYRALCAIKNRKRVRGFYTISSYKKHIESYLKL